MNNDSAEKSFSAEIKILYAVVGFHPTTAYTPCFLLAALKKGAANKVAPGTSADEDIVNVSKFWVGDDDDDFERRTPLDLWGSVYLPLIMRQ
jgi:hypothetical protein